MEIAHLLTGLHLLRSYFNKEHVKSPVLQFFKEHLPNLSLTKDIKTGQFELEWKGRDGNLLVNHDNDKDIHAALLRHMSIAFPNCSAVLPSFGGCETSSKSGLYKFFPSLCRMHAVQICGVWFYLTQCI